MTATPSDARARRRFGEAPPTAGLPLKASDLFGRNDDLEAAAAQWLGVDRLRLTCSGTAALIVALLALKERSDRRVVVAPAYTCPLVAIAVARAGLTLRLCDLAPDSLDLDPAGLETACGADMLAIIPTHLAGRVSKVGSAIAAARRVGAFVIEDAAQGFGARTARGPVGTDGDIGFYSLAVGKGLTIYEGGLLWARDPAIGAACDRIASSLLVRDAAAERRRIAELLGYWALYRPLGLRLAYGLPLRRALARGDVDQAIGDVFDLDPPLHSVGGWRRSVGASALERLASFQDDARSRALSRLPALQALPTAHVFEDGPEDFGIWPTLLVTLQDEATRDAALRRLWTSGLGVSRLFARALPDYDYLRETVGGADVPNARSFAARSFTITNSSNLSDRDFEVVISELSAAIRTT